MNIEPGLILTAVVALVGAIGWLFRVEARTHQNKGAIETLQKTVTENRRGHEAALLVHAAKAEGDARDARRNSDLLIRMEEQLKHLTTLVEGWQTPPTRRKPAP